MHRTFPTARRLAAGASVTLIGTAGCLPDDALRTILAEQIAQTSTFLVQAVSGFAFNLGDTILNTIVSRFLTSFVP